MRENVVGRVKGGLQRSIPGNRSSYPFVIHSRAFAYRSGVFMSPSLSGSSPIHSRTVLTAAASFFWRSSFSSSVEFKRASVPLPVRREKVARSGEVQRRGGERTSVSPGQPKPFRSGIGLPTLLPTNGSKLPDPPPPAAEVEVTGALDSNCCFSNASFLKSSNSSASFCSCCLLDCVYLRSCSREWVVV